MKRVFYVHFNRANAKKGLPWTVHYSGKCYPAKHVKITCPIQTLYKGDDAPQPRAVLRGKGELTIYADSIWIS